MITANFEFEKGILIPEDWRGAEVVFQAALGGNSSFGQKFL